MSHHRNNRKHISNKMVNRAVKGKANRMRYTPGRGGRASTRAHIQSKCWHKSANESEESVKSVNCPTSMDTVQKVPLLGAQDT